MIAGLRGNAQSNIGLGAVEKNYLVDLAEKHSKRPKMAGEDNGKTAGARSVVRLRRGEVQMSQAEGRQSGMVQISVKCLCLRSCPWSSASISLSLFGSSSGWAPDP